MKVLHQLGADINAKNNDGWTAVMWAARNGHSECVKVLHQLGADINAKNNNGWTAVMRAASRWTQRMCESVASTGS